MTFSFSISDELNEVLVKLSKKDKVRAITINKKIREVISQDEKGIEHYKNLRYGLSEYKRVHIDRSFVLLFKVLKKENHVLFVKIDHHDNIYKR